VFSDVNVFCLEFVQAYLVTEGKNGRR